MIIGSGMIARSFSAFSDDPDVVIFASGVSNSLEYRKAAFNREKETLLDARSSHRGKLLVYFGTCSADDPERRNTPYVEHKLEMESLLQGAGDPWLVLRLPLVVGPRHGSTTLAEFLYERISRSERFEVWRNATRYPLDVADVFQLGSLFIGRRDFWNSRINIALRAYPVLDFVRILEDILQKPADYALVEKGQHYALSCPELAVIAGRVSIAAGSDYLRKLLTKYFG